MGSVTDFRPASLDRASDYDPNAKIGRSNAVGYNFVDPRERELGATVRSLYTTLARYFAGSRRPRSVLHGPSIQDRRSTRYAYRDT